MVRNRLETVGHGAAEGRRRWFKNLGLTQGGMVVDNTTLFEIPVKEIDLQGNKRSPSPQEEDCFFQELIEASVVSELEPKTEKIIYEPITP